MIAFLKLLLLFIPFLNPLKVKMESWKLKSMTSIFCFCACNYQTPVLVNIVLKNMNFFFSFEDKLTETNTFHWITKLLRQHFHLQNFNSCNNVLKQDKVFCAPTVWLSMRGTAERLLRRQLEDLSKNYEDRAKNSTISQTDTQTDTHTLRVTS